MAEYRKLKDSGCLDQDKKELQQKLDLQLNMSKCQKMTIEKLETRIMVLETHKNEDMKVDQTNNLEKA